MSATALVCATVRKILLAPQSVAVGGMENQSVELAAALARLGLEVAAVLPEHPMFDGLAERISADGSHVERIDTDARRGRPAQGRGLLRLIRFMRAWRPDVVHVHTGGATGGVAILAAARLMTSAAVVLTEHDVPVAQPGLRLRTATFVKDHILHALVALSAQNAALRRGRVGAPPRKFAGIRPGVRLPFTRRDVAVGLVVRERYGIEATAVVIGSAVRLASDKGVDDLLRAFGLVCRETPCDLLLVGDGPLRTKLELMAAEFGITQRVHFAGYQANPAPFFNAFDIFALAVPSGSGSIALLEAMSRGLPAVITHCGPGEFLVPDVTGLCAPPRDPEGLASAILRLVRDSQLRRKLGAAGEKRVRATFDIDGCARDLVEVYGAARRQGVPSRLLAKRLEAEE